MRRTALLLSVLALPALAYAQSGHVQAPRGQAAHASGHTQAVRARYAGYAKGFNAFNMDADWTIGPADYKVHTVLKTAGAIGAVYAVENDTTTEGRFAGDRAQPRRFYSYGHARGRQRITLIDYPSGDPVVRQLVPANDEEREPVPEGVQARTVDTLSVMAQLLRRIAATGRCDGRASTFDGRRASDITARTGPQEVVEASSRSSYSGPALRCDFEGKQTGGFMRNEDQEVLRRIQRGTAWFARVGPGEAWVPIRVQFETRMVGSVTMYLQSVQ